MNAPQSNFKRYEKKYLISLEQYLQIISALAPYMCQDDYGRHTICSLYLDTNQYELIRASIEKPVYKEKLRLRSYGVPGPESQVFLELKKKYQGVVYKRRISMTLKEAQAYLQKGLSPKTSSQILKEIDWFLSRYHTVPKLLIAYERQAFAGIEDPNLRVTFDQNIRFRDQDLDLADGDWGQPLLKSGDVLMEIKIPGAMPLWLSHLLTAQKVYPVSFSKCGVCYKAYLIRDLRWSHDEFQSAKVGGGLSA